MSCVYVAMHSAPSRGRARARVIARVLLSARGAGMTCLVALPGRATRAHDPMRIRYIMETLALAAWIEQVRDHIFVID